MNVDVEPDFKIQIIPDKTDKTLTIYDTGIGMSKKELITNLENAGSLVEKAPEDQREPQKSASPGKQPAAELVWRRAGQGEQQSPGQQKAMFLINS